MAFRGITIMFGPKAHAYGPLGPFMVLQQACIASTFPGFSFLCNQEPASLLIFAQKGEEL